MQDTGILDARLDSRRQFVCIPLLVYKAKMELPTFGKDYIRQKDSWCFCRQRTHYAVCAKTEIFLFIVGSRVVPSRLCQQNTQLARWSSRQVLSPAIYIKIAAEGQTPYTRHSSPVRNPPCPVTTMLVGRRTDILRRKFTIYSERRVQAGASYSSNH